MFTDSYDHIDRFQINQLKRKKSKPHNYKLFRKFYHEFNTIKSL